jgi:hypothetical protein
MVNKRNKSHRRNKTNKKNRKNRRRLSKKMYGGVGTPIDEVSNNTGLINASADYQQGKNQVSNMYNKTLNLADQPQTSLNLQAENANNFFNSSGIGSLENAVGTTVSNGVGSLAEKIESKIPGLQSDLTSGITDTSKKVSDLKNILTSQKGQELLSNAGEVVKQVFEKVVEPVGEEALAEGNKLFKDEGKILANEVNQIATVFPPVLFAEELANVGAAIGKGVESGLHMFSNVANLKPKIDEAKAQFGDIKDKFGNLMADPRYSQQEISKGGSLKSIRRQSKMIGGRCRKAQDEFLHPQLVLSQLIKPHKRTTKRSRRNKR